MTVATRRIAAERQTLAPGARLVAAPIRVAAARHSLAT
jgi:hypothetical protein